jgi:predicted LPLAT superfamily acyltransferase/uncharacterized protein (DUF2062 family)
MNCRFLVCIPTYNNPTTILQVIKDVLISTPYPVLVVDDGSDIPIEKICTDVSPLSPRVSIYRHSTNQGKGLALQSGFKWALKKGYTHLITLDGDAQHLPSDITLLATVSQKFPWSLIVGDRNMEVPNVPSSSVFGKAFSNFWIKYQTDQIVKDSQSGFRIYPLFYIQTMKFLTSHYEFEIEVLTRLIWKGVDVQNVQVSVQYFPPEKRVSHFNKWRDNFRISITNTLLVCLSLLREPSSPLLGGLAVGIGVAVGTTPLIGLHTLIVLIISLLLRLNFVYLWLGTQISIPPLMPFLIIGSTQIGDFLLGPSSVLSSASSWSLKLFFGSLVLGSFLGTIIGSLFYFHKKTRYKSKTKLKKSETNPWSTQSQNHLGIKFLKVVMKFLGLRSTYFCLYFIVPYYYIFNGKARRSANEYWKIINPDLSFLHRQFKIYLQMTALAKSLVDRAYQISNETLQFTIHSHSNFQDLYSDRGKIFICTHFGGWDMAMYFFKTLGLKQKMLAVMYNAPGSSRQSSVNANDSQVNSLFYNEQDKSILKIKSYLDNRDVVALMGDRPVSKNFELIPFFGKLALFDTTAFRIGTICSAEIFCIFSYKIGTFDYQMSFEKLSTDKKEEPIIDLLMQYVIFLEHYLKKHPEQWYNFFHFWSELPPIMDTAKQPTSHTASQ